MISVRPVTGPVQVLAKFRVGRRAESGCLLPFGPDACAQLREGAGFGPTIGCRRLDR
jgi:hypothetical protein